VGTAELESIKRVLDSGILTEGRVCAELERRFARYIGCHYAVAASSCTSALHLALIGIGIGAGDEVIVPDFTFPATANAVLMTGARPVLVDIDLDSYNIDSSRIREVITDKTRAIIAVHLFGLSADMLPIRAIAKEKELRIVEDAACAIGATYRGAKVGTLGDVACFSFHPRKIMTTAEGGMITTDDRAIAELVARLKNHGAIREHGRSKFVLMGYNYRLSDVHAAIGLVQLKKIKRLIASRARIARLYTRLLESIRGIVTPSRTEDVHTYQSYVIRITDDFGPCRDDMIKRLRRRGVETQIGTYALHLQPAFKEFARDECSSSALAYESTLSLPIASKMTASQVKRVVNLLRQLKAK
jgi:dTDP-4-amino-4,6-dideoxygalactose transaminase